MANFEENLQQGIFSGSSEKTFLDKLLARQEVDKIRDIIKKPRLTREDLLEVLYLLSGTEAKLVNYSEYDRYVVLKFFVWIREFIKVAELLYDYEEKLNEKEKKHEVEVTPRTRQLLDNNKRLIEHNAKFLIDLYFNIARTTLSIGGTAFLEALKNKYEVAYTGQGLATQLQPQQQSKGLFNFRR